ncbi:hypothetical protein QO239_03745 [Cupriavidus taiwanensis]|uniref:hypothetical protein n=1 Tax=Cupriavidus taiwanensis TaxID=164546 RepID=UPI002541BF4C|nr:hypothetical protein [Cupriavidus taiwanensis]MDK3021719.1 hypothetical protein [Cupriavidus taiwanensis]
MDKFDLSGLLARARAEQAAVQHIAAGMDSPHAVTSKPAAASQFFDLRELFLPSLMNADGIVTRAPAGEPAAKTTSVSAAVVSSSLVAKAGAHVIVAAERPAPAGGLYDAPVLYRDAGALVIVDPATFGAVVDGADATTSALPVKSAAISWPDAPSIAFSTNITRRQGKDSGYDLEAAVVQAIVMGLARAADKTLLAAIVTALAAAPTFTLGAAAARGLEFVELRALIGTAGTGAAVGQDGTLRAAGVLGELTPTIAETIVGSFTRAGVAIHPQIAVHAKRTSLAGNLELTVFANMLPLVPDAGAFWKAA